MPNPSSSNSAARLAGLLDSAMDAIISVDETQHIVMYNQAAERIFGWSAESALGQPLSLLIPKRFQASHETHLNRFAATGVTSRRMGGRNVILGVRSNGDEFPVDASISQLNTPEGKLFTVILRDATERVRAEQEQARLAARLAGLLDSAMDAIITVDQAQRIALYNQAAEKIFGWPANQVTGRSVDIRMPQRFRSDHRGHIARFGATGGTSRRMGGGTLICGLRASGEEFPLDASISQLDTPDGKLFTVILRDVTERVKAHEERVAFETAASAVREQEKARIAREMHDELAQSLTALKMDALWLQGHFRGLSEQGATKLAEMIDMLDSTVMATRRIAADLRPPMLDDLGLPATLDWLVQTLERRSSVRCTLELVGELDLQEPYATTVFRTVQESLANVAKHANASTVHVTVSRRENEVSLRVQDNGVGFDMSGPRRSGSLGLVGLKERVELVKGVLIIESSAGYGCSVAASFPVQP